MTDEEADTEPGWVCSRCNGDGYEDLDGVFTACVLCGGKGSEK
jgi:hypothetical protein